MPIDRQRNQTLFRRLSRLLKRTADKPQAQAVHQLRTAARRIESLLQALSPEADKNQRRLLKQLSRLRRRAGKVRDMDVQMALLRGLKIGRDSRRRERLMQLLAELRAKREKKLVATLDKKTRRDVQRRLRKAAQKLSLFQEPPSMAGCLDVAQPFDPVTVALREFSRVARAQGALREDNLHAYRLETKHVRYVAEMAGADKTAQKIVAELKRMQDAIGEWHDWLELTQRAQQALEPAAETPLMSALQNVTRAKFREALSACNDTRKELLEVVQAELPLRKPAAGVRAPAAVATA